MTSSREGAPKGGLAFLLVGICEMEIYPLQELSFNTTFIQMHNHSFDVLPCSMTN